MRKEDDLTDGFRPGEQHDQSVDAHAQAPGRRHAVFEGVEKFLVNLVLLTPALLDQTLALHNRIVKLGVTRGNFLSVHDQFEHIKR